MKNPYIIYSLSKNRTTQKFNKSKLQDILKDIAFFLQHCTTATISEPNTLQLTAYEATDPVEALNKIIKKTIERFGTSEAEPIGYHYPSGEPDSVYRYNWTFTKNRWQEAIEYIIENSPLPKSSFGSLELFVTYDFKLVDTINKKELPNQDNRTSLCIWFSRTKSCSPTLFFPFEQADLQFWNYVDSIAPYLPFKLEEQFLRIAHVNKQGEIKSFKKIQRPKLA
ncbi:hypothetical protein D3C87_297390 [compost metagenome]